MVFGLSIQSTCFLPDAQSFIKELLVKGVAASGQELLGELVLSHEKSPRLVAIVLGSVGSVLAEPSNPLLNMVDPSQSFDLCPKLVEIVS